MYLVKLPNDQWMKRGKATSRLHLATIYNHPSAAKRALDSHPCAGAEIVPFSAVTDQWHADRAAASR